MRAGTEDVAGAVGFAVAAELAARSGRRRWRACGALRDRLEAGLRERVPDLVVNGAGAERAAHVLNVSVPGREQRGAAASRWTWRGSPSPRAPPAPAAR